MKICYLRNGETRVAKVAIVGSRNFKALHLVRDLVASLPPDTIVLSGGASGVDKAAIEEARLCCLQYIELPARWDLFGKRAGMIRNQELYNLCDYAVCFWDDASPGTAWWIHKEKTRHVWSDL